MKSKLTTSVSSKKLIVSLLLVCSLLVSIFSLNASAATYTVTLAQGDSSNANDCLAFDNWLDQVSSGNNYVRTRVGWTKVNNTAQLVTPRAGATDLINAKNRNVLYWSSHGSSNANGPSLRVDNGAFNVAQTLGVSGSNWQTNSEWRNSTITVAMFAACKTLDNTHGQVKFMARLLRASNLRVITGYHEAAPQSPYDKNIVDAFFGSGSHIGVTDGESIRSSWKLSNEWHNTQTAWAVLCYQSNNNQFYRMPGFPGLTYNAPAANSTVYRYWSQYPNGQIINPAFAQGGDMQGDNTSSLPFVIYASNTGLPVDNATVINLVGDSVKATTVSDSTIFSREMVDADVSLDPIRQFQIANDFIANTIRSESLASAILTESAVIREEIDPEFGLVAGTETVVGMTYAYSNQYNGIRIVGNFIKVGTDVEGIEFFINRWKDVEAPVVSTRNSSVGLSALITQESALSELGASFDEVKSMELVYAPVSDNMYRLCYEIMFFDAPTQYVDSETGKII